MKLAVFSLILLLSSTSATAADRTLTTMWMIGESLLPAEAREVKRGEFVVKHRLLPMGLAELAGSAEGMETGKQLVEIQSGDALVFCDPIIRSQKLVGHAQPCLVDADRDGRFEGLFHTTSVTKGMLTIQGKRPKTAKAIPPLAYRRLDPGAFAEKLFVGAQYRGSANLVGNHVFEVNYGSDEKMGSLSQRFTRKGDALPAQVDWMGGRFTLLGATAGGVRVRVEKPLPSQPFGVLQTTTYRIY
jgi:hypothetical protein